MQDRAKASCKVINQSFFPSRIGAIAGLADDVSAARGGLTGEIREMTRCAEMEDESGGSKYREGTKPIDPPTASEPIRSASTQHRTRAERCCGCRGTEKGEARQQAVRPGERVAGSMTTVHGRFVRLRVPPGVSGFRYAMGVWYLRPVAPHDFRTLGAGITIGGREMVEWSYNYRLTGRRGIR